MFIAPRCSCSALELVILSYSCSHQKVCLHAATNFVAVLWRRPILKLFVIAGSTVYMTEVKVHEMPSDSWQVQHQDDYRHGNPITNKGTTLLGEFGC